MTSALDKYVFNDFNYIIKTFISISKINLIIYSQYLIFLKVFKTFQYFYLIILYFLSSDFAFIS